MADMRCIYTFLNRAEEWTEQYIWPNVPIEDPDDYASRARAFAEVRAEMLAAPSAFDRAGSPRIASVSITNLAQLRQTGQFSLGIYGSMPGGTEMASLQAVKIAVYANGKQQRRIIRLLGVPTEFAETNPYDPLEGVYTAALARALTRFTLIIKRGPALPVDMQGALGWRAPTWTNAAGGHQITAFTTDLQENLVLTVPGCTISSFPVKVKVKGLRADSLVGMPRIGWAFSRVNDQVFTNLRVCRDCGETITSFGVLQVPGDPRRLVVATEAFAYGWTQRRPGRNTVMPAGKAGSCCARK